MKKIVLIISLLLLIGYSVSANTPQSQVDSLVKVVDNNRKNISTIENQLEQMSKHIEHLEYATDKQKEIIEQEQTAIGNSLASSSRQLDMFALIVAFGGIFLGWYMSKRKKEVEKLLNTIEEKKTEVIDTGKKVSNLNKEINENIKGLYERLRQEETTTLLNRLVEVPEDVGNLAPLLLSRPLLPNDFKILLEAYNNLLKENTDEKVKYLLLFFQHFCGQSIKTDLLRQDVVECFSIGLKCAFKQDVTNSLLSLIKVLNSTSIEGGNENILTKYIIGLNNSKHKECTEPYQIIIEKCNTTINLQAVWNNLVTEKTIIEPFGNLLCERYKEDLKFITKVKEQIASLKKDGKHNDTEPSDNEKKELS